MMPLYSFLGGSDGSQPYAPLVQGPDGLFYGTAARKRIGHLWHAFSKSALRAPSRQLCEFTNGLDGGMPVGGLAVGTNGALYGTTTGPQNGYGTLFKVTTNNVFTALYSFTGASDGDYPQAGLVLGSDGNFYGTTALGGTNGGGAVFRISHAGGFSKVMSFIGGLDGNEPLAPLVQDTNGDFYGTTYLGGTAGYGLIYQLSFGGILTPLYSFTNGTDGANPAGGLAIGLDGNLYGTTYTAGSTHVGTLFKVTTNGGLAVLHAMTNAAEGARRWRVWLSGRTGISTAWPRWAVRAATAPSFK